MRTRLIPGIFAKQTALRRLRWGALCLAVWCVPGWADSEVRARYPPRCGSNPDFSLRVLHGIADKATPATPSIRDVDLNHIAILEDDGTLVTIIGSVGETNTPAIQSRFFASHQDLYTYICIFVASTFAEDVQPEAGFAFEQNLSNDVRNIGLNIFNPDATLRSRLNMNDLGEYGKDPSEELPGFLNTFSGVDVLGQEAGHMVGAFVQADNADIVGRGDAHWSFFFETYGSVLEGNGWLNTVGTSWTTVVSGRGHSELDNYLYGFLLPDDFSAPMYVLDSPIPDLVTTQNGDASLPVEGVTVQANSITTVTIDNVIAAEGGERVPSAETSPKTFRMAFILVVPPGTSPAAHDLEKIDDFRVQWEEYFAIETSGVGTMVTELDNPVPVTADFESHELAGDVGLTVHFDNDSFGSITSYLWDFGDGNTSTERHPVHTYAAQGSFDVTLTVDGNGGPVSVTKSDLVRVGPETVYFQDDFETDQGWMRTETSTTGNWARLDPQGTYVTSQFGNDLISAIVQPEDDHTAAGTMCLITGNTATGATDSIGTNDVDGGTTTIVSPPIDLSSADDPVLSFWSWYTNNAGAAPGRDTFVVELSEDGGASWTTAFTLHSSHHSWRRDDVRIADHINLTDQVHIRFRVGDEDFPSLVEAAVDDVKIYDVDARDPTDAAWVPDALRFALEPGRPNPFRGETHIRFAVPAPGSSVRLRVYGVDGRLVRTLVSGPVPTGVHTVIWDGTNDAGIRMGRGVYFSRLETPEGSLTRKLFYAK